MAHQSSGEVPLTCAYCMFLKSCPVTNPDAEHVAASEAPTIEDDDPPRMPTIIIMPKRPTVVIIVNCFAAPFFPAASSSPSELTCRSEMVYPHFDQNNCSNLHVYTL